jgi:hypothetical protein
VKLEEFIDSMKNSNTTKKTKSDVKLEIPKVLSTRGSIWGFFHERLNMDISPGRENIGIQLPVPVSRKIFSFCAEQERRGI